MISRLIGATTGPHFTERERSALQSLRNQYQREQHVFTRGELAHLRFLRWRVQGPDWNRGMDRPGTAEGLHITAQQRPIWTRGFIA
ncbi:MAG: hypothetical protein JOZ41_02900 [Chloroflexi bacterium]|nr:hypothetical protein [Chloroflexota bacterium]